MPTEVEVLGRVTTAAIIDAMNAVALGYAESVRNELNKDKPRPPARGSMVYKSERQRRFVMASISKGKIKVPYIRGKGNGRRGSETLNRSYRVDLEGVDVVLTSAAGYAPYVVGDQQAQIHQGRWKTALQAADDIAQRGTLEKIVNKVFKKLGV